MTTQVNIARGDRLHESGYRYRRELIQVVHENFKGTITRIVNLIKIAKQLQIPPAELEHGLVRLVKKVIGISTCGPLTFPGHREAAQFDSILQNMIEKYILCPQCVLPEWNGQHCAACGYSKQKKAKATSRPSPAPITECLDLDAENEAWVVGLANHMHKLYDQRAFAKTHDQDCSVFDKQLDQCWMITSKEAYKQYQEQYE
jgi:hypothetical protein